MVYYQQYEASFQLDGREYHVVMHIEQISTADGIRYCAVIDEPPLSKTFGGKAETVELALDFLNLAMQAEGADDITFTPIPLEATG